MTLRLDHVVIRAMELDRSLDWYTNVLGLVELHRSDGAILLGCGGDESWDLGLRVGGHGLDHVAFSVEDEDELYRLHQRLTQAGHSISPVAQSQEPGVKAAAMLSLPAGHCMELVVPQKPPGYQHPADAGRAALHGPSDLDHITFATTDIRPLISVLQADLEFRVSDIWEREPGICSAAWLRSGDLHHNLAALVLPADGLHHVAFAVPEITRLRDFADRFMRSGQPAEYGIGRHGPGGNLFLYVRDPSKNRVELTTEMPMVSGDQPRVWRGQLADIVNLWAPYPPPASFAEAT
jgi:catechol 2,3-dioxygenase